MPDPALDTRLAQGFAKLALVMRHEERRKGAASGLSPLQAQILALLGSRGALRLTAIAENIGVRLPAASEATATLEGKGLVTKGPDPADTRARLIQLTRRGRREVESTAALPAILPEALAGLDDAERAQLLGTLVKMIAALERAGRVPLSRMCVTCVHFRPHAQPGAPQPHFCAFIDAPLSAADLRIDCSDHAPLEGDVREAVWQRFAHAADPPTPHQGGEA